MFINTLFYSLIAGISTIIGTLLIFYKYKWAKHNSIHLMSFAAGIMLSLAFLHLIPEALEISNHNHLETDHQLETGHSEPSVNDNHSISENKMIFLMIVIAFVIFSIIESLIRIHPRHDCGDETPHKHSVLSVLSITGLTLHSLIDGVIIAVGFKAGFRLGIMTTIAVVLHEVPEGIITTSILLHDTMKKNMVFFFSLLVAIATPIGAISSYFLIGEAESNILKILIALAAGSLIYISASDLIPETHKSEKRLNTIFLIAGIIIFYVIGNFVNHGH